MTKNLPRAHGSHEIAITSTGSGEAVPTDHMGSKRAEDEFIDMPPVESKDNLKTFSFSFSSWCFSIIRWTMATRTDFGRYLASLLCIRRDGPISSPTALFPLPLPDFEPVAKVDLHMPKRERLRRMLNRPLLVVISALNYAYCSRGTFPIELMKRQPNELQQQAIDRLRLLIKASDPGRPIEVASSGRKNLVLVARLQELLAAADALGFRSNPYHDESAGIQIPMDNSWDPKLKPYSSLNADRLKITGKGDWDAQQHLEEELLMAFKEPMILENDRAIADRGLPDLEREDPAEVKKLLMKWDKLGLLELHSCRTVPAGCEGKVKIFNAAKNKEVDRQIGDRRWRNAFEGRIPGPSKSLPTGASICRLLLPPGHGARISITDRSDFYHQISCTFERSKTNLIWPPLPLGDFKGSTAYDRFVLRAKQPHRKIDRTVFGDGLNNSWFQDSDTSDGNMVLGSFRSVLQGDQLGVEFGISAHMGLLRDGGALLDDHHLLAGKIPRPNGLYQGLVIDDFFSIAAVPATSLRKRPGHNSNGALKAFIKAKEVYAAAGLQGSDAKDVVDAAEATVVGAQIDSRPHLVSEGQVICAAPKEKRLALTWLLMQSAKLGYTTEALHASLVGSLVSAFCFRRVAMAILDEVFKTLLKGPQDPDNPSLHCLPRRHAGELVLAAALLPVASSNLLAQVSQTVYASDASNEKGAFVKAEVDKDCAEALWLSGDFKGKRSYLMSWPKIFMRAAFDAEEEDWAKWSDELPNPWAEHHDAPEGSPERPLAQYYDFLEVCGGSGVLSDELSRRGFVVGPIIDITYSPQFDLVKHDVMMWLIFMVRNGRVRALAIEPPCTSFSPAAYPAVRSYSQPRGFQQKLPKVWIGNRLAFRCLALLWIALQCEVMALLEQPRRSKMAWLQEWLFLLSLPRVREISTASCAFGSPHQKEFRFLTCNMVPDSVIRKCSRDHEHVRIEGAITKGTAVYCPGLVKALGEMYERHLRVHAWAEERTKLEVNGMEEALVNEVVKCSKWQVGSCWKWTGKSHINILETASYLQALKDAARRGEGRASFLLDSAVALFSTSKGRSSSRALAPILRKIMAIAVAFGVFPSGHFCPTRLNIADDPTRDAVLREKLPRQGARECLDKEAVYKLASLPKTKRWTSNWISLVINLALSNGILPPGLSNLSWRASQALPPISLHQALKDFDSTLGFPGEGPFCLAPPFLCFILCLISAPRFMTCRVAWILVVGIFDVASAVSHGIEPRHAEDETRARARASKVLEFGRPVLAVTRDNRQKLLTAFSNWLDARGYDLREVLKAAYKEPEHISRLLCDYGRELFDAGRPYNHYCETINAVGSARPEIRRLMAGAWDLAFAWLREEPYEHHVACPFQVLLALLSVALLWGWIEVAAILALSWGGLCRIGEVLAAKREDLILPSDVLYTAASILLRVQEPKTRFRAARHQMAKIEYADLVKLICLAFEHRQPQSRLWGASPQLLRNRFKQLLVALRLPSQSKPDRRALDLGSMRAGGATHLQMLFENPELTRRRGRWLSNRTMEIYLQEAASTVFFPHLPSETKAVIMQAANSFPDMLKKVAFFAEAQIPPTSWYWLIQADTDGNRREKTGGLKVPKGSSKCCGTARTENSIPSAEKKSCSRAPGSRCESK